MKENERNIGDAEQGQEVVSSLVPYELDEELGQRRDKIKGSWSDTYDDKEQEPALGVEPTTGMYASPSDSTSSVDSLGQYLKEVGETPLLTHEQEKALGLLVQAGLRAKGELQNPDLSEQEMVALLDTMQKGLEAKEVFVRANLRLSIYVANMYKNRGIPYLDLIQEGNLGLMRAVDKYDPNRGFKFVSYGVWWLRQSMSRSISEQGTVIRLPDYMSVAVKRLFVLKERYILNHGEKPDEETLRALYENGDVHRSVSFDAVQGVIDSHVTTAVLSLDKPVGPDQDATLADFIPDSGADIGEEKLDRLDIIEAMRKLNPRAQKIIIMRFGLGDNDQHTLAEVGELLGITRERVRQIESKALKRINQIMNVGTVELPSDQVIKTFYPEITIPPTTTSQLEVVRNQTSREVVTSSVSSRAQDMLESGSYDSADEGILQIVAKSNRETFREMLVTVSRLYEIPEDRVLASVLAILDKKSSYFSQ